MSFSGKPLDPVSISDTIAVNQNDYAPTGIAGADFLRIDGGASNRDISGIVAPVATKQLSIANVGAGVFSTKSLLFDATNEHVVLGDVLDFDFNVAFSISAWFKTSDSNGYLVSKIEAAIRGYGLLVDASGSMQFVFRNTSTIGVDVSTTETGFNDGGWHHVVVTHSGSGTAAGMTIYVDGVSKTLSTNDDDLAGNTTLNTEGVNFNGRTGGSATLFPLTMDDVAIYDKELTSGEVTTIYNSAVPIDLRLFGPIVNLVGYWLMGDGATFPNIPEARQASVKSLLFDGVNEYVTMGDVLDFDFNATFSISCWFKTTDSGGHLVSKIDGSIRGYSVVMDASGSVQLLFKNSSTVGVDLHTTATGFNDGEWHHVAMTHSGSGTAAGVTIYVDGTSEALTTDDDDLAGNTTLSAASFNINSRTDGVAPLTASIDEVAVYDKELTSGEVTTIYNKGATVNHAVTGPTANLVGYWKCGDGATFPTILDDSVNSNDGTMTNMESGDIQDDVPLLGVMTNMESGDIVTDVVAAAAGTLTFNHNDPGSAAANRFVLGAGADVILAPAEVATLWYDDTDSRWRVA